jgi:hypothetical protein
VVKNGPKVASERFAAAPPTDTLPASCENIRALVIIFPDFFSIISIIYNTKNLE